MPAYTSYGNCDNYARYASYASYASYVISQGIHVFRPSPIFVVFRGGAGPTRPGYSCIQAKPQYLYYSGGNPHAQSILIFRPSPIFVLFRGGPTRPGYSYIQAMPNICIIPGGEPLWECHRHPVVSSWETRKNPIESLWDHHRDPYRDPIGFPYTPRGISVLRHSP